MWEYLIYIIHIVLMRIRDKKITHWPESIMSSIEDSGNNLCWATGEDFHEIYKILCKSLTRKLWWFSRFKKKRLKNRLLKKTVKHPFNTVFKLYWNCFESCLIFNSKPSVFIKFFHWKQTRLLLINKFQF